MLSICGADCCGECNKRNECGGCVKTAGHPFGGTCIAAECIKRDGFEVFKKMKEMLSIFWYANMDAMVRIRR